MSPDKIKNYFRKYKLYYSSGNYEAFATPKKPEGIENKYAHIVGTGLGGLAAACFLIRDAQMPGDHITLY